MWAKIGVLGFGGPAGQVALMHRELVERRNWIDEGRFLHALNYCMLLPGPEAQQLAVYIGWLLHRTWGGIVAGLLFVLPGFVSILGLSILYASYRELPAVAAIFFGLKAAVLAIVVEAVLRIGRRALRSRGLVGVAVAAFVAIFLLRVPFPAIVLGAAIFGAVGSRVWPAVFARAAGPSATTSGASVLDRMAEAGELQHTRPSMRRALRVLVVCTLLWGAPIVAFALALGVDSVFVQEGIFFSKTAVVTFGGAYAVLAYIAQRAVDTYGWLAPGEMMDGLGLAETTPGPLIMVVQFVGYLGAARSATGMTPIVAGIVGSLVTVWVTFVPCFLWIFLGAPYVESLRANRSLAAALSAITAAVVGVVGNLAVWFGMHVMFREVHDVELGPLHLSLPVWSSVDLAAVVLSLGALVAMLRFHVGLPLTLLGTAALGVAWMLAT